jgi:hypothetical protein
MNARGHRDLGNLVSSLIKDITCTMISQPDFFVPLRFASPSMIPTSGDIDAQTLVHLDKEGRFLDSVIDIPPLELAGLEDVLLAHHQASWPEASRTWRMDPPEVDAGVEKIPGQLMPGLWTSPPEYPLLPRLAVLEGWNPNLDHQLPPFHPICLSTRSNNPVYDLSPLLADGWERWVHPEHLDKPYLLANTTGARVSFELETNVGIVKMYSLRSKTFGLGTVECWADKERDKAVKINGWWDNGDM